MKRLSIIALFCIIIVAFALRFYKVTEIPPALNWDEISIGYNAYSVLQTGKDEWGQFLPIHFRSYGEYKLPVQLYASIPGIAIFGLNEFGVRITPVLYGTLTVLILFFLARRIFNNTIIGLLAAFLLAISPWHIHLTRGSFESSLSILWIVLGVWLLIKGFDKGKWWIVSMVPFALSMYTYNSARVFTPLFLVCVVWILRNQIRQYKRYFIYSILFFVILMIPIVPYYISGEGNSRYKLVSITDDPGLVPRINETRGNSPLPAPLPRLLYNKVTFISYYFLTNYLSHFTPQFLFISGAPHKQHHVQNIGELYAFQAPFLVLGLYLLYRRQNRYRWLIISWILLAFIPVSITNDSIPHALRTLIAAPVYQLLSAYGLYISYEYLKKKDQRLTLLYGAIMTVIISASIIYYLSLYYGNYAYLYSRDWQYGYKQAVEYINVHKNEYDEVIFTRHYGEPHMFTLFYLGYDPDKYQNDPTLNRFETYDWVRVLRFTLNHIELTDRAVSLYFPDLGDIGTRYEDIVKANPDKKLLFIGKPGDFPPEVHKLSTINFLNGDPVFEIVEVR